MGTAGFDSYVINIAMKTDLIVTEDKLNKLHSCMIFHSPIHQQKATKKIEPSQLFMNTQGITIIIKNYVTK